MIPSPLKKLGFGALIVGAGLLALGGYLFYAPRRVPAGQPALVHLDARNLRTLRDEFNAASEGIRLLVLLSPT